MNPSNASENAADPTFAVPPGTSRKLVRVMHVINGEHYAGAECVQDLLAQRLPEEGFEVGFACLKPDKFAAARVCQEAMLYRVPMHYQADTRGTWRLQRICRQMNYQLVHTHTPRSAMIGRMASLLACVPMVHHVHSPTARDTTSSWRNIINTHCENISITGVSKTIAVSHSLEKYLRGAGYDEHRIQVIPNGVPIVDPVDREPPSGEWILGTVALIRPRKGIELLLDAVAALRRSEVAVRLRAVGQFETADYGHQLKSRTARLGIEEAVQWAGFTRDVKSELDRFDLFVLPSLFGKGLPMVVLEAMAAGVPVVGTNVEGVPEAIRDGVDGVIAQPGDAVDLAENIQRIIRGDVDWSRLRASALQRQREHFSDRAMARKLAEVYREVLAIQ